MSTPPLTHALRELVWRFESEVAVIGSLSRQIDDRVTALNAARRDLASRLARLDALLDAADETGLRAVLQPRSVAPLPLADELLPDRLYG